MASGWWWEEKKRMEAEFADEKARMQAAFDAELEFNHGERQRLQGLLADLSSQKRRLAARVC